MRRFASMRSQAGVAMITVIMVAAGLTVVSSTAAFIAVREFRSGVDDRRGAEALSYAESGVDRLLFELNTGTYNWRRLNEAGCAYEPIVVPEGDLGEARFFNAYLTVYDPALPETQRLPAIGTWEPGQPWSASTDSSPVCVNHDGAPPGTDQWFAMTATGQHPTATRVVRQVVKIGVLGLPIGLYADSVNVQGGTPDNIDISLVTPGDVHGRERLRFTGMDPYYKLGHFWDGDSMTQAVPAALHARGTIYCDRRYCGADGVEHPIALSCTANGLTNGQSQWDQSGGGGSLSGMARCSQWTGSPSGPPPYSSFSAQDLQRSTPTPRLEDQHFQYLREAARRTGLYCSMTGTGSGNCTTPAGTFRTNGVIQDREITGVNRTFVAYFDYPAGGDPFSVQRTISWHAGVGPCSVDQNLHRSVIVVVRYGSLDLSGHDEMVGSFFVHDGRIWMRGQGGQVKVHGTAIAKEIDFGGNAQALLSDCWVQNMPGPFLGITPVSWSEVDR